MKEQELNNLGLKVLNASEMNETNGGFLLELLVVGVIVAIAYLAATDKNDRTQVYVDGQRVEQ
ncbi:hypothetical protein NF867_11740 [Solitalea sp. MAHUQ-68]|uniref:Uncharacterized protein n=1 Tax=Solitalea agri TaxID=2953739 RepID=A0A9X2F714_9SPHI|nr:hypothetical protein [Solitalea agri]MCO4293536.1 hypothetical protein [Solitalea agri]